MPRCTPESTFNTSGVRGLFSEQGEKGHHMKEIEADRQADQETDRMRGEGQRQREGGAQEKPEKGGREGNLGWGAFYPQHTPSALGSGR